MPIRDGINVNEDIWGVDAMVFNPERWLEPGALSKEVTAGHVLTFGDGPKVCLGRSFGALANVHSSAALIKTLSHC